MGFFDRFNDDYMGIMGTGFPYLLSQEKMDIIRDPKTSGKKAGYNRAAKEFKPILAELKNECESIKMIHEINKKEYDKHSELLLKKLKILEDEKERLNKLNKQKTEMVESKYGMAKGTMSMNATLFVPELFDLFFMFRKRKYDKAEIEGYEEARKIYQKKINLEKEKIVELKKDCDENIKKTIQFIADILDEISSMKLRIAELKLMAGE